VLLISSGKKNLGPREEMLLQDLDHITNWSGDGGLFMIDIIGHLFVSHTFYFTMRAAKVLQTSVISGQGAASIVQHYVKGEYQPPTYGYSGSYGYAPPPADTNRDVVVGAPEAPMHEVSDHIEQITVEPVSGPAQGFAQGENVEKEVEEPVEEKKQFTAPFTAWDPAR
jgi:hypothetical protein